MPRSALVIVVDRLGAGYLGPYGNTWLETPELNRLAAESRLWETALADASSLDQIYRGYWSGRAAVCGAARDGASGLASDLAVANIPSELITDSFEIADHALASGFDDKLVLPEEPVTRSADDATETQFASLLAAAIDRLQDPTPRLIWLHARGLAAPWDAPYSFREQFRDEEDPPSPEDVAPPEFSVARDTDPDLLLGWTHAYAGQVAAFDLCWGALLDAFRACPLHDDSLLMFTSPRGYPLGEHGWVGPGGDSPREESSHVPLLVRRADGVGALERHHRLVQPADLDATLREWFGLPCRARFGAGQSLLSTDSLDARSDRRPIVMQGTGVRAIRTSAWFLRQQADDVELYVKPDDRCEVNEIGSRRPDVVEGLVRLMNDVTRHASESLDESCPVGDDLLWTDAE